MWVSCILQSDSHRIDSESFTRFQSESLNIRIERHDDKSLCVHVGPPSPCPAEEHVHHAHQVIKAIVLALNVGSLGHFYWKNGAWAHPVLTVADDLEGTNSRNVALVAKSPAADFGGAAPFTNIDEYRTSLLFGVFARGSAHVLEDEYCRGLLLFHMQFGDINFRRDSFMCFYRVMEHFVTRRVLGKPKLQNELKDIQSCIRTLDLGEDLACEMREIYRIRSAQTAHAQKTQRSITADEVMKMKVYIDAVLFKVLFAEANTLMEQRMESRTDG